MDDLPRGLEGPFRDNPGYKGHGRVLPLLQRPVPTSHPPVLHGTCTWGSARVKPVQKTCLSNVEKCKCRVWNIEIRIFQLQLSNSRRVLLLHKTQSPSTPPTMAENTGEHPETPPCCSAPPLAKVTRAQCRVSSSSCFSSCALHPLLSTTDCFLQQSATLLCPPLSRSICIPGLFGLCVYIYFTVLAPSFYLLGLHSAPSCFFPFMFPVSRIAQFITEYHPVTLYHTHLLLPLLQPVAQPEQAGG